jgi:hypothetical protein
MAKNLLDQIISLASGSKWTKEQSENFEQSEVSRGLSGVEKYLQRKSVSTLTGVARYLERKSKEQAEKVATQTAVEEVEVVESSVEKYLRRKAGSVQKPPVFEKKLSRVERYLQQKEETQDQQPAVKPAKPAKPVSSVDKYLKSHDTTPTTKAAAQPTKKPSKAKAKAQEKPTRCQAATSKGKQCSRTSKITKIQRTINKKKYNFTVCSQHNNDSFKPFADFVEND